MGILKTLVAGTIAVGAARLAMKNKKLGRVTRDAKASIRKAVRSAAPKARSLKSKARVKARTASK